jgi:tocopherol cyclase
MEHFAPHNDSAFEGYYSKFALPSGAHVALVICAVPDATTLPPYMVSFTHYPADGSSIYQREHWVDSIERVSTGPGHAFELRVRGKDCVGSMAVTSDSSTTYDLRGWGKNNGVDGEDNSRWSLEAMTANRTPWHPQKTTPEGLLVKLPLPLHWHVHSLSSPAAFHLDISSLTLPKSDQKGRATVHQEKNWANSFPAAHVWIQARDHESDTGICLAGGEILGMHAFILGYRSPSMNIDMLPPFALSVLGLSPFTSFNVDYANREFSIQVSNWWRKIVVRARAPREKGWFGLGAPFKEGHRTDFCTESFLATVEVEIYSKKGWLWGWVEERKQKFEGASLEFAGEWFEERGLKRE